jgi:hypothetical protein
VQRVPYPRERVVCRPALGPPDSPAPFFRTGHRNGSKRTGALFPAPALAGVPGAFGVAHAGFLSGRLTSSNEGTWVFSHQASSTAPQTSQGAPPVCGIKNFSSVRLYSAPQSHWTIVVILRICAPHRPFSSPEVCHNHTDPLPHDLCFGTFVLGAAIASDNCRHAANMRLRQANSTGTSVIRSHPGTRGVAETTRPLP